MSIAENLFLLNQNIPSGVKLVCVSKTYPSDSILEAYDFGERVFGESKVQELINKYDKLPKDIEWHYIGHLQSNKVRFIIPFVTLIHGVDSDRLLKIIDKESQKIGKKTKCLLQIHIAKEENKFGFSPDELIDFLKIGAWELLKNVEISGLMGMATFTDDDIQIRNEFRTLKQLFDYCKREFFDKSMQFEVLSMGMSSDYPIAIEEGSTMLRIGTSIFGNRTYNT